VHLEAAGRWDISTGTTGQEIEDGRGSERGDDALDETRLGVFPEGGEGNAVAEHRFEYQQELEGIVEGCARARLEAGCIRHRGVHAFEELPDYYVPWLDKQQKTRMRDLKSPGIAALSCHGKLDKGRADRDGAQQLDELQERERWRIVFDIAPKNGYRMLMMVFRSDRERRRFRNQQRRADGDGNDDYAIRRMGPNGKAEFVRAEGAAICGFDRRIHKIMLDGNNGDMQTTGCWATARRAKSRSSNLV